MCYVHISKLFGEPTPMKMEVNKNEHFFRRNIIYRMEFFFLLSLKQILLKITTTVNIYRGTPAQRTEPQRFEHHAVY